MYVPPVSVPRCTSQQSGSSVGGSVIFGGGCAFTFLPPDSWKVPDPEKKRKRNPDDGFLPLFFSEV